VSEEREAVVQFMRWILEELKDSHTFRRLTSLAQAFSDADHHLERFASM